LTGKYELENNMLKHYYKLSVDYKEFLKEMLSKPSHLLLNLQHKCKALNKIDEDCYKDHRTL